MLSDLYLRVRESLVPVKEEEGQGMVEYALILVLIAVVVIRCAERDRKACEQRLLEHQQRSQELIVRAG